MVACPALVDVDARMGLRDSEENQVKGQRGQDGALSLFEPGCYFNLQYW